ncbi:hypothetical protein GCM10007923_47930 [Shinella yambaruensis]|uniref:BioY family protein n=1 Tax=Shinella yambaruensis TaxID=415996 RepID=A0ABQ5ZP35_9HYPH|nr:hypothetical protein GCM10007923_47930 [Shinella yambaruensis]
MGRHVVVGLLVERLWQRLGHVTAFLASATGGIVVLYGIGVPWSAAVARIPLSTALTGSLPFLPGDIIKCVIAATVIVIVRKSYPIITPAGRQASAVR